MSKIYNALTRDPFNRSTIRSRIIRFVIVSFLSLWAIAVMFLMDAENELRPEFLGGQRFIDTSIPGNYLGLFGKDYSRNFVADFLYNVCDITPKDVSLPSWLIIGIVLGCLWVWALFDCFDKKIRKAFKIDDTELKDHKRRVITYKASIIIGLVMVAIIGIIIVSLLTDGVMTSKSFSAAELLTTLAISLILIAIWPVIALIGILVYASFYYLAKLCKWLFGKKDKKNTAETEGEGAGNGGKGEMNIGSDKGEYDISLGKVFPALKRIDEKYADGTAIPTFEKQNVTLAEIVKRFRAYLCNQKLYFDEKTLRNFIGGLSVSRLLILEGLSGTGKSTLPRLFSEFVGNKVFYSPVQATWRDRTDLVGYYSEFTQEYKETDFLKRLYEANFKNEEINMMVLDEMNISRIEYYFADFLSILEYPSPDWLIKVMQLKDGQEAPTKFIDGNVQIPTNTWFIGTANTDDSTFTISDKVYDRAIVLDFLRVNEPFTMDYNTDEIHISSEELLDLFKEAQANEANRLNDEERAKFKQLCNFVLDTFNVTFGNRIMNQIENFVPVYVALGGTKTEALDFIFSRKVMRKLQGKYDEYVKDGLTKMVRFINGLYGKDQLPYTEESIVELRKKLI